MWTLARIAGHSSIGISSRYVHPSEEAVLDAISRLGGHKIGHNQDDSLQLPVAKGMAGAEQTDNPYSADVPVWQGFHEHKSGDNSIPFGVSERQPKH